MKAIEIQSKTDKQGFLKMSYPLERKERDVRVIIMFDDSDDEESQWLKSISNNPAFNFLLDEKEDVYSFEDGEPINDLHFC